MTTTETIHAALNSQPFLHAAGWALVHSLWQGALVALLYACLSALLKESAAGLRHAAGCAALVLMLFLPAATVPVMLRAGGGASSGASSNAGDAATRATLARAGAFVEQETALPSPASAGEAGREAEWSPTENLREWVDDRFASLVPWLVVGWLMGVVLLVLRFAGGFVGVRRLKRSALPVADELQRALARLAHRLRVTRAVRLCESALVEVPTVVGHLKPIILLPACALTGLKPAQLEAVLAHELAHIRRHDYLFNLLQTTTETLLFYHPAAWWLSRRVRAEREHASDDLAVSATGDVLGYARALAALEQLRRVAGPSRAGAGARRQRRFTHETHPTPCQSRARTHAPRHARALRRGGGAAADALRRRRLRPRAHHDARPPSPPKTA